MQEWQKKLGSQVKSGQDKKKEVGEKQKAEEQMKEFDIKWKNKKRD